MGMVLMKMLGVDELNPRFATWVDLSIEKFISVKAKVCLVLSCRSPPRFEVYGSSYG